MSTELERKLDVLAEYLRRLGEVHDAALIREAIAELQRLREGRDKEG